MFLHIVFREPEAEKDLFHFPAVVSFALRQAEAAFVKDCIAGEFEMLLEMADAVIGRHGDGTGVRLKLAEQYLEERGFPVAIPADQADLFALVDIEAQIVEKDLSAE
jgi:hypothetical protein